MSSLRHALEAFYQEHRCCAELDGGVDGDRVWMRCSCADVVVCVLAFD